MHTYYEEDLASPGYWFFPDAAGLFSEGKKEKLVLMAIPDPLRAVMLIALPSFERAFSFLKK